MTPEQAAAAQAMANATLWGPVLLAVVAGVFATIRMWSIYLINRNVKDQELAKQLDSATDKALGVMQQAAEGAITARISPSVQMANIESALKPGVQYVLDHAAEGVARFESTWPKDAAVAIAEKITAKAGLASIATNLAVSAAATTVVAKPLDPVPAVADPPVIVLPAG